MNNKLIVPRHYLEEFAHMLGKTYWELMDQIKMNIDKTKAKDNSIPSLPKFENVS